MEAIEELPRTPDREDCVKRLFGEAGEHQAANTSEYFSQSSQENCGTQLFSSPDNPPDQVGRRTHTPSLSESSVLPAISYPFSDLFSTT